MHGPGRKTEVHNLDKDGPKATMEQFSMDVDDTPLPSGLSTPATAVSLNVDAVLMQARRIEQPELANIYEGYRLNMSTINDELPPLQQHQVTAELVQFMFLTANSYCVSLW